MLVKWSYVVEASIPDQGSIDQSIGYRNFDHDEGRTQFR